MGDWQYGRLPFFVRICQRTPKEKTPYIQLPSPFTFLLAYANLGKRNQYCAVCESELQAHRKFSLDVLDPYFDSLRCIMSECCSMAECCSYGRMRSIYTQIDFLRASRPITATAQVWQRARKITTSPSVKRSQKPRETVLPACDRKIAPSSCETVSCIFPALAATAIS